MKIRNGFVSNSSSSSFLVYGASFDTQGDYDKADEFEVIAEELDLECKVGQDAYETYLGISPEKFPENETLRTVKEEIQTRIRAKFPDAKCDWHSEAWYNG